MANRKITRIYTPDEAPGFLGAGHTARPVIQGGFSLSDPFILLMDDVLDKKDNIPVGGPHPHAGFETVSLLLEGEIGDDAHTMRSGDFQLMTAGSGIIHTETIDKKSTLRMMQLWLNLPKKDRWATPRVQDLPAAFVPSLSKDGVTIKLYSGSLAGLRSPIQHYTPLIVADIIMEAGAATTLPLPGDYNTFLYVLNGSLQAGEDNKALHQDQVGWLDVSPEAIPGGLPLTAGKEGVRFLLYAGKPTGEQIVSYGPFIADSLADIQRLYKEYGEGKMQHIAEVPAKQRIVLRA